MQNRQWRLSRANKNRADHRPYRPGEPSRLTPALPLAYDATHYAQTVYQTRSKGKAKGVCADGDGRMERCRDSQKIRAFQRGVLADLRGKCPPFEKLGHKHDTEEN